MNRLVLRIILFFILFISFNINIFAEQINQYDVQISINKDASLDVIEKIIYDFGNEERHGIIRNIPYIITNSENKKFKLEYTNFNVLDQNKNKLPIKMGNKNLEHILKIGDPNKTITGIQTYIIQYSINGGIQYFSDHDEIFFNSVGTDWNIPIFNASTVIRFSENDIDQPFLMSKCYTGEYSSTNSTCTTNIINKTIISKTEDVLSPKNGYSVVASFKKNIVDTNEPKPYVNNWKYFWIGYFLFNIIGTLILGIIWWFNGKDPIIQRTIVREYEPPVDDKGIVYSPIEVGVILDEVLHPRDISAEIINLAVKKLITIKENKEKKIFGLIETNEIHFIKGNKFNDEKVINSLNQYQKNIFKIFQDHLNIKEEVLTDDLKPDFLNLKSDLEDTLYENIYKQGLFDQNPEKKRNQYYISTIFFTFLFPIIGIFGILFAKNMPRRTIKGAWVKYKSLGLYKFITSQDRQFKFQEEEYYMFERLLPYAVAMGVATIWAKKFEHLTNQPDWFITNDQNFSNLMFINTLENNLNKIESMYTPTTTSSSSGFNSGFSSGGGFSGGGFSGGGGGGNSW